MSMYFSEVELDRHVAHEVAIATKEQRAEIERLKTDLDMWRHAAQCGEQIRIKLKAQLATAKGEVVWTTERPTESGWYWMQDGSSMAVVKIEIGTFDGFYIEWAWQAGSRMQTPLSCFKDMQWAGPLTEPKEPA